LTSSVRDERISLWIPLYGHSQGRPSHGGNDEKMDTSGFSTPRLQLLEVKCFIGYWEMDAPGPSHSETAATLDPTLLITYPIRGFCIEAKYNVFQGTSVSQTVVRLQIR